MYVSKAFYLKMLSDFVKQDISRLYPDLLPHVTITLVEAGPALLGPFDAALQEYAHGLFKKRDIDVRLGTAVTSVENFEAEDYHFTSRKAVLSDGSAIEFGTMVWSAGLAPRTFTSALAEDGKLQLHARSKTNPDGRVSTSQRIRREHLGHW